MKAYKIFLKRAGKLKSCNPYLSKYKVSMRYYKRKENFAPNNSFIFIFEDFGYAKEFIKSVITSWKSSQMINKNDKFEIWEIEANNVVPENKMRVVPIIISDFYKAFKDLNLHGISRESVSVDVKGTLGCKSLKLVKRIKTISV